MAVVNFTSPTFSILVLESIGFPSVVTPPPEGCLAFRPRPEAARGFVGVQAGPREPEVTAGSARGREVLRGAGARSEDRPWEMFAGADTPPAQRRRSPLTRRQIEEHPPRYLEERWGPESLELLGIST